MAKLTTKERKGLKASTFGLPKERKFPMPDKSHAANAKARAAHLPAAEREKIDRKADKILKGGSMKKEAHEKHERDHGHTEPKHEVAKHGGEGMHSSRSHSSKHGGHAIHQPDVDKGGLSPLHSHHPGTPKSDGDFNA